VFTVTNGKVSYLLAGDTQDQSEQFWGIISNVIRGTSFMASPTKEENKQLSMSVKDHAPSIDESVYEAEEVSEGSTLHADMKNVRKGAAFKSTVQSSDNPFWKY